MLVLLDDVLLGLMHAQQQTLLVGVVLKVGKGNLF